MSEPVERPDDSPVTWRELREAVAAIIDFQMKMLVTTTKLSGSGREAALDEEREMLNAAAALEDTYKIDELVR